MGYKMTILEITGDDVKELNDTDLRALIGKLCEVELTAQNFPVAGVTWGGDQDAQDGGVDVRVDITTPPHPDGFIPRANTVFQVKKPDMPRGEIIKEMKPKGQLRDQFKTLAEENGAYIIVSSQGSTTDSALNNRKNAMTEVLAELPNGSNIKTGFYDRGRVATWVNSHSAMILWLRQKLGRPIQGWQPYDCWTGRQADMDNKYLCDNHIRLFNGKKHTDIAGMKGSVGIAAMREILAKPKASIRLTGLSGVGKTRLLQALFDEKIGDNPLPQTQVCYTDIGDSPIPDPKVFAQQLIAQGNPCILAVDNCRPELHGKLTAICSAPDSLISLITVEHDVQDDQQEDTEVFRLEPSSDKLIEDMLQAMFSDIGNINSRTIAGFAGGNARIAIALAKTVEKGDDLSSLEDPSLFNRLFQQGHEVDKDLLKAAEVCALVYSFDITTTNDKILEMQLLSTLTEMTVKKLYSHISELKRRELVQERGVYRAVLPQALANRLAKYALKNIPFKDIQQTFEQGQQRLLISFSRRLGYLHQSDEAKAIVAHWLADGGLLGNIGDLDFVGITLLNNIAPVDPPAMLAAIESATGSDTNGQIFFIKKEFEICYDRGLTDGFNKLTNTLQSIAYDETLFLRAVDLLVRFALVEQTKTKNNQIKNQLKSLFYLYLSGTHASARLRLEVIERLIATNNAAQIILAFELLDATLEAWSFSSTRSFEFGARPRDHGYQPQTSQDTIDWYRLFINFTVEQAIADPRARKSAKTLLAKKFKGLWIKAGMSQTLTAAVAIIADNSPWQEGWAAVKETLAIRVITLNDDEKNQLNQLAEQLAPRTLIENIRCYALSYGLHTHGPANQKQAYEKAATEVQTLGQALVQDEAVLQQHLAEILSNDGGRYTNNHGLEHLGQGMATSCTQPAALWQDFKQTISQIDPVQIQWELLQGFLSRTANLHPAIANTLLDKAVEDSVFSLNFPRLQSGIVLDDKAVARLRLSLEVDAAPIEQYIPMTHKIKTDNDCYDILQRIMAKSGGLRVAVKILYKRLINTQMNQCKVSNTIAQLGHQLLLDYSDSGQSIHSNNINDCFSTIIYACFSADDTQTTASRICCNLYSTFGYDNLVMYAPDVLEALATKQPVAFLDSSLTNDTRISQTVASSPDKHNIHLNLFVHIADEVILNWCDDAPAQRYPLIATAITPFEKNKAEEQLKWTALAQQIMTKAPDPVAVLDNFMMVTCYVGPPASTMQTRLPLLNALKTDANPLISQWASNEETKFTAAITAQSEQGSQSYDHYIVANQRFE
jgi:hypothetical protein